MCKKTSLNSSGTVSQSYSKTTVTLLIMQSTNLKIRINGNDSNFLPFPYSLYTRSFKFLRFHTHDLLHTGMLLRGQKACTCTSVWSPDRGQQRTVQEPAQGRSLLWDRWEGRSNQKSNNVFTCLFVYFENTNTRTISYGIADLPVSSCVLIVSRYCHY